MDAAEDELGQKGGQEEEMEGEEQREAEGADSALPEYLPRQACSTRGKPKYTYSDKEDDEGIDYEYSSSDNMSIEETPPFKSNDTIYATAHDEKTVTCMLISFLEEVSALVPRPLLTWTMERLSFTATLASGKKFTAEADGALWGPEERVPRGIAETKHGLRAKIYIRVRTQETAEMATWFATTAEDGLRKLPGHRLLASQNSNECTITLAKPGRKYRDYLTDPKSYGSGKEFYVKMQEYGLYDMTIADDVRAFAKVHLAFALVSQS